MTHSCNTTEHVLLIIWMVCQGHLYIKMLVERLNTKAIRTMIFRSQAPKVHRHCSCMYVFSLFFLYFVRGVYGSPQNASYAFYAIWQEQIWTYFCNNNSVTQHHIKIFWLFWVMTRSRDSMMLIFHTFGFFRVYFAISGSHSTELLWNLDCNIVRPVQTRFFIS